MKDWTIVLMIVGTVLLLGIGRRQEKDYVMVLFPAGTCQAEELEAQVNDGKGNWHTILKVEPGSCVSMHQSVARLVRSCCPGGECSEINGGATTSSRGNPCGQ